MNAVGFSQHITRREQEMGKWDRFKSRPMYLLLRELFVFVIALFLFMVTDSLSRADVIGQRQFSLLLGFVVFGLPLYLAIRFFRDFHLNNPKRKIFFSKRLAALASTLLPSGTSLELNEKRKKPLTFSSVLPVIGAFKAQYTMDLLANQGGIILGGPAKMPGKMKDTTFYWLLSCGTILPDMDVSFSNRGGIPEKVRLNKIQEKVVFAQEEFLMKLKALLKKTVLKGELRILDKQLYLYLYDNVKSIEPLSGDPVFNHSASKKSNIEMRSFENIYKLLHLFAKGVIPTGEAS